MADASQSLLSVATSVADHYRLLPEVEAVVLAGSYTSGAADQYSDVDMYVYSHAPVPLDRRAEVAAARADYAEVGNEVWEPGDEWIERNSGVKVDVMFRDVAWIEMQLDHVLKQHQASAGYSTCLWHNVRASHILYDRAGWFRALQEVAREPYPEPLRRAIIAKNHPILRQALSSYRQQLKLAVARGDAVSVQHRVAALLASYFDIVFAVNRLPHPGEKRLIAHAQEQCTMLPVAMNERVHALLNAVPLDEQRLLADVDALVDSLDHLLRKEGLLPVHQHVA
jgi:predicted nucleotidyltransferase